MGYTNAVQIYQAGIVTFSFLFAPQSPLSLPCRSFVTFDSQGLLHTLSSLSHPRPRLLVLLLPISSYLALYVYTFPPRPLSYTPSDTPEH